MVYDTQSLEKLCGPLPYNLEESVKITSDWMKLIKHIFLNEHYYISNNYYPEDIGIGLYSTAIAEFFWQKNDQVKFLVKRSVNNEIHTKKIISKYNNITVLLYLARVKFEYEKNTYYRSGRFSRLKHLCDRFIAEGYFVIGMDNLITGDLKT